jgi:hypothetical protein
MSKKKGGQKQKEDKQHKPGLNSDHPYRFPFMKFSLGGIKTLPEKGRQRVF